MGAPGEGGGGRERPPRGSRSIASGGGVGLKGRSAINSRSPRRRSPHHPGENVTAPARRLGEILLADGVLTPERLRKVLETQGLLGGRFGTNVLELGFASEETILAALARQRNVKTVSAAELKGIPPSVVKIVSEKLAKRYKIVPFRLDGKNLFLASVDPEDLLVQDEVGFLTGCKAQTFVGLEFRIAEALERCYRIPKPRRMAALSQRMARTAEATAAAVPPAEGAKPAAAPPPSPPPRPAPPTPSPISPFLTGENETRGTIAPEPQPPSEVPATPPPPRRAPVLEIELGADDLSRIFAPKGDEPPPPTEPPTFEEMPFGAPTAAPAASTPAPEPPPPEPAVEEPHLPEEEPAPEIPTDPESRLEYFARELQAADLRDEIGDAVLGFAGAFFQRCALFVLRKDRYVGWRAEGEGVDPSLFRQVDIGVGEPSILLGLREPDQMWLGPLPPMPKNLEIVAALGGSAPKDCLVLPIALRGKVACYLYVDNRGAGIGRAPVAEMRRLVFKAGLAFEVYILRNKIRVA